MKRVYTKPALVKAAATLQAVTAVQKTTGTFT
jgi:hypothetical protein